MNEDFYMMWLSRSLNLNLKKTYILLERFGKAEEVWHADYRVLLGINGITDDVISKLKIGKEKIEFWIDELNKLGIEYISINSNKYPELLKHISDPPVGLYIKGHLFEEDDTYISVIGARRCSDYGKNMAYNLSNQLAKEGVVIVSGMARGIDSLSHQGALKAKGKTIAVLGFGHKYCYPAENKSLMEQIAQEGCLISEYPPDTEPAKYMFPQRNRIIAGLSEGLIVIEAGEKSGTLTTVDFALEEGRNVMTLPANITSQTAKGTNELIKQGCPMITNVDDVFFEMGKEKVRQKKVKETKAELELPDEEKKVYALIGEEPVTVEYIMQNLGMSVQDIQYILTMLELGGMIQKQAGEKYVRAL